ncbi:VWA domain-containing protein [Yinghuangia sp. ASG 101]|uniref:VWA domain-containing protein n=1 Tax=Yinghuangia sp. ASG 101 TaxID=2896848 RepID=UPI001E45C4A7|nr:VWA domain-containing protein [Yinghuangia sp. ASG 101]UGQ13593.1 VWA domain-containing protein [Yinghuangia sp. ASG 101]
MPAHRHVHHTAPAITDDELASARWDDDGGPVTPPSAHTAAREAEWLRIGAELTGRLPALADRDDVIVTCEQNTRSGSPAAFFPTLGQLEVSRGLFAPHHPSGIRPAVIGDENRYATAWGALVHEAAHAAHSAWGTLHNQHGTAAAAAAEILDESRAEHAHLGRRPSDRPYLRRVVHTVVMDDMGTAPPDDAWSAALAAGLILARRDAGILEAAEAAPVEHTVTGILGADTLAELAGIWAAAHQVADDDADTMLDLGRAWCEAVGVNPTGPEPHLDEAQGGLPGVLAGAIGDLGANVAQAEQARAAAERAAAEAAARAAQARVKARKASAARARNAADLAKKVFAPNAGTVNPNGGSGRTYMPSPVTGTRTPTTAEKAAAGRLARGLRNAAYRERVETTTSSATPPGRLNMRAALARDAQRAAGAAPTALPWRATQRRATPTPPLRVGIAVDVSGSMRAATGPVSSAAWIIAKAAAMTDPASRTATVAFDADLTAVTRPGRAPAHATEFTADGAGHALAEAIDALDAALDLTRPGAGRLLVIASDGVYDAPETAAAADRIRTLTAAGCAVLHLDFGGSWGPHEIPGARMVSLTDPATAADEIAKAAIAQVAATG